MKKIKNRWDCASLRTFGMFSVVVDNRWTRFRLKKVKVAKSSFRVEVDRKMTKKANRWNLPAH